MNKYAATTTVPRHNASLTHCKAIRDNRNKFLHVINNDVIGYVKDVPLKIFIMVRFETGLVDLVGVIGAAETERHYR